MNKLIFVSLVIATLCTVHCWSNPEDRERTSAGDSARAANVPFFRAVRSGNTEEVGRLLGQRPCLIEPHTPGMFGMTPLFAAIQSNSLDIVRLVLEYLVIATHHHSLEEVLQERGFLGQNVLHAAATVSNQHIAGYLLMKLSRQSVARMLREDCQQRTLHPRDTRDTETPAFIARRQGNHTIAAMYDHAVAHRIPKRPAPLRAFALSPNGKAG